MRCFLARLPLFPPLLAFISATAAEGIIANGPDHCWYMFSHEFAFVEVSFLMVMIPFAVFFDLVWHYASRGAESRAFAYGSLSGEGAEPGQARGHKQLLAVLVYRMGTEFMTVGFLALLVFVSEHKGLFHVLERKESKCLGDSEDHRFHKDGNDCFHLPETSLDWFHMAEIVHFSLFVGMCLYFALMSGLVWGAVREIRVWEKIRRRDVRSARSHHYTDPGQVMVARMPTRLGNLPDEDQYRSMQQKFVDAVVGWQGGGGGGGGGDAFWSELLKRCGIGEDEVDAAERLRTELEGPSFDFSAYLAFQVEDSISDAVEVHSLSWFAVWVYLAITWPLHRLLLATMPEALLAVLVAPALLWLAFCLLLFKAQQAAIARRRFARIRCGAQSARSALDLARSKPLFWLTGRRLMRAAQVICIICSYALARLAFAPPDWSDHFEITLAATVVVFALWILVLLWLAFHAPIFLALMSLPPYFSQASAGAVENFWKAFECEHAFVRRPPLDGAAAGAEPHARAALARSRQDFSDAPPRASGKVSPPSRQDVPEVSPKNAEGALQEPGSMAADGEEAGVAARSSSDSGEASEATWSGSLWGEASQATRSSEEATV